MYIYVYIYMYIYILVLLDYPRIYIYIHIDLFIYHILVRSIINIQKRYDCEEWMIPIHERLPTYIIHIKPQWYMTSEGYETCTSGWLIPNDLGVDYTMT